MKKIILLAMLASFGFSAGNLFTTVYLTPTVTTNYNTAKIKMTGSNGNINTSGNVVAIGTLTAGGVKTSGSVTANKFIGDGSGLTGLTGTINASDINISGTLTAGTVSANQFGGDWSTWTPTTDQTVVTFSARYGWFKTEGKICKYKIHMYDSNIGAGSGGTIKIGNFPRTIAQFANVNFMGDAKYKTNTTINNAVMIYSAPNEMYVYKDGGFIPLTGSELNTPIRAIYVVQGEYAMP